MVGPDSVVGVDHVPPFGSVAAFTTWRVPSHNVHAAVTLPRSSTPTGTKPVMATPPMGPLSREAIVHAASVGDLTATCIFCCESAAS